MSHRLRFGLGIAAAVAGATALLAPPAAAQEEARELAPGVSCGGLTCRNDTDDTYRVEGIALCSNGDRARVRSYVAPHTEARVIEKCAPDRGPGTWKEQPRRMSPGTWENQPPTVGPDGKLEQRPPVYKPGTWENQPPKYEPGPLRDVYALRVDFHRAVVDNAPPPAPTGSAG
ncbi:hypothetical protein BJY24_002479 [Nocardia transvalensis]|uniref:Secreted protein n=1 Tax=Nocardia transvalensis TaxID=37333 RepID=A0A7W9PCG5_9NOCA|nr:hypothetical protein [Nocardia transvalensis]MBB5913612.1 hypothetical protein [Nocardia transvalensis]